MPVINQQESDWDIDLPEQVHDPADANPLAAANIYTLEHHIVYSPSYQVPVLYFNVYDSSKSFVLLYFLPLLSSLSTKREKGGSVLPWEQVDRFLRVARGSLSSQQAIISQTEHPILGLPFFYIHPCETQRLLKTLAIQQLTTSNFIKVWLSFIGPEAFCNISFRLFSGKQTE